MTAKPPSMQRSRSQLATAYAPHSLFTFEGGSGACMALPSPGNRAAGDELSPNTQKMISEQIQEYFEAWALRAARGIGLRHPVPLNLAVDGRVVSDERVRVRSGEFAFQIPDHVGYVPFPLSFVCTRCNLHISVDRVERLTDEASRFRTACPSGADSCADNWQQLDVVFAHWSGSVEPITPSHRRWQNGVVQDYDRCENCNEDRFYLHRPPGRLANWVFQCVECKLPRPVQQRDLTTLEELGPLIAQNQALPAEINMEPVSYRASAAYYVHGDRLLVFDQERYIQLLNSTNTGPLVALLSSEYGYPPTAIDDAEKERLLLAAGQGDKWNRYRQFRSFLPTLEAMTPSPVDMINEQRAYLAEMDADWNRTVFAGHQQAVDGIERAGRERTEYVRRFDPVRMALEHKTLTEERLRGRQMPDGKDVSVDLTILDDFLFPDDLGADERSRLLDQVRIRRDLLGMAELRLVRDVRVCEYTFGYTRTSSLPTVQRDKSGTAELPVRLRLFDRVQVGDRGVHPILCLVQSNEGFYIRLDEECVLEWLEANGIRPAPAAPGVRLGGRLIEEYAQMQANEDVRFSRFLDEYRRERSVPRLAYPYVYTLLHTMAHHLLGTSSSMSGLDLGSFGEHIFVPDLAFLVYRRGMTMDLGNLSSMWRDRGDPWFGNEVLERMVDPASLRCGSESVCNHRGGACPDCLLIPESACLTRNELLSRSVLIGRGQPRWDAEGRALIGYYDVARRRAAAAPVDP
ncbi:hypothetical protein RPB_2531 [Rhodopseudomonas palustris HaA2]|uniref:DUF1998 domain-containing protein n=1 Tax=Rhodopseudomonas palustris (strain HaA2) TaxID=316058 RepID=Q2IX24_RHOP2|nr:hypothetical protein [Rhodopseudomonas palustris]ABD07236.1 hypothetical protein RPB_2531 [Rhodopseudomonas palustris HaA2]